MFIYYIYMYLFIWSFLSHFIDSWYELIQALLRGSWKAFNISQYLFNFIPKQNL